MAGSGNMAAAANAAGNVLRAAVLASLAVQYRQLEAMLSPKTLCQRHIGLGMKCLLSVHIHWLSVSLHSK